MNNDTKNLEYVKQILEASQSSNGYPAIYLLWGCIVFIGYAVTEYYLAWTSTYWLIAAPIGMVLSAWLGIRGSVQRGQQDNQTGDKYMLHFGLMLAFIFVAIFTQEYRSILLLIGLGYCLAGLYLEKLMLGVGILSVAVYMAIHVGLVTSNLLVGTVFALGFFACAWGAAKLNADAKALPHD